MSLIQVLHCRPDPAAYTLLAEHQSTTPASFFNSAPVLHFRCENCQVISSADLLAAEGPFHAVFGPLPHGISSLLDEVKIEGIDCFIGTNAFILFNPVSQKSISIPYPSITLHALKQEPILSSPNTKLFKIYLQLSYNSSNEESLEDLLELAVVPLLGGAHTSIPLDTEAEMMDIELEQPNQVSNSSVQITQETLAKALFSALSKCSNLHPTQPSNTIFATNSDYSEGEEGNYGYGAADLPDGVIPFSSFRPSAGDPGEGGWITAENVDEFKVATNGTANGTSLGPGAGSVRPREDDPDPEVNGGTDAKWRRTG